MAYGPLGYERHEWLEDWLEAFPGSIICTSHFNPFPGQDVHAQRRLPGPQTENLQGHKEQLLDTARGKASREAYFEISESMAFTVPETGSFESVKSRSKVILRMNNVALPTLRQQSLQSWT